MASFLVSKSNPLKGRVTINGAKNSVLPIMAASLLSDGTSILEDVPLLEDVSIMCQLLEHFGSILKWNKKTLYIDNSQIKPASAPYDLVRKMRASFLVMGILSRFGNVKISLPVCYRNPAIDLHLGVLLWELISHWDMGT